MAPNSNDSLGKACKKAVREGKPRACMFELSRNYFRQFEMRKRADGEEFLVLKDGAPEELEKLVQDAHGDFSPDDFKHEFVKFALGKIDDTLDVDMDADLEEAGFEIEPDIMNADLLRWLSSNLQRPGYVDEAREELGSDCTDIMVDIGSGQVEEKREVYRSVIESLEKITKDFEE